MSHLSEKNGRLSFETQLKIEFLLPNNGSKKRLEKSLINQILERSSCYQTLETNNSYYQAFKTNNSMLYGKIKIKIYKKDI